MSGVQSETISAGKSFVNRLLKVLRFEWRSAMIQTLCFNVWKCQVNLYDFKCVIDDKQLGTVHLASNSIYLKPMMGFEPMTN
ncbi:hypothetical protein [Merismopedia glauca]|uniref:Uncharacterized protein n=1 Tax=Merismopedia glauca CCAP 1448/3 TaxID=1296344 RepID=A0A2T1C5E3_9CYAN|nr:hypothetical protein [Merismopedia glauca]PSB03481.1 hypothetical protein C7B64_08315 [Merismopedia glauca CCAP 1448/3]